MKFSMAGESSARTAASSSRAARRHLHNRSPPDHAARTHGARKPVRLFARHKQVTTAVMFAQAFMCVTCTFVFRQPEHGPRRVLSGGSRHGARHELPAHAPTHRPSPRPQVREHPPQPGDARENRRLRFLETEVSLTETLDTTLGVSHSSYFALRVSNSKSKEREDDGSAVKGTPAWLAPEVIEQGALSTKADVYSFGIILYEMLTRGHPYPHCSVYQVNQNNQGVLCTCSRDVRNYTHPCIHNFTS